MANLAMPEKINGLKTALDKAKGSLSVVAAKHITPERVSKIVVGAAMRNPLLLECLPQTIVRSVMQAVELGLEPGSALNHAYLVPFKNKQGVYECQLIVGYMGMVELANRSGLVSTISAECVYEGDLFEYELGLNPILRHVPADETIDPAAITHAYCVVTMRDGSKLFRVMTRKALDRIRGRSRASSNGPWVSDTAEMYRKTVIRNVVKLAPKSIEMAKAIKLDDAADTGDLSMLAEFEIPEASYDAEETPAIEGTSERVAKKIKAGDVAPVLVLSTDERRDFEAFCASQDIDPVKAMSQAATAGVVDVAGLYAMIDGGLGL